MAKSPRRASARSAAARPSLHRASPRNCFKDALKLTNEQVSAALGGLPAAKSHCPVLAEEAVKAAVEDYLRRRKP